MRIVRLEAELVEFIPEQLAPGVLYVSRRYSTAAHLCCCGCGLEVITPLNPAKWHFHQCDGSVSLSPSIGNWSFPCQSHYWIEEGLIRWAGAMSPAAIAAVKARDRMDARAYSRGRGARLRAIRRGITDTVQATYEYMQRWWSRLR